jgi:hypothetical protein
LRFIEHLNDFSAAGECHLGMRVRFVSRRVVNNVLFTQGNRI